MIWARKQKKAFTLIEVVVVIAIIGILGAIVTVSTIAILRNSERKSVETTLTNYWRLTEVYFDQVNKGMTTYSAPQRDAIATRLNMKNTMIQLKTAACKTLSNNYLYIQYAENPKSMIARYSITKMTYRYKGTYYKTEDGRTITHSETSP